MKVPKLSFMDALTYGALLLLAGLLVYHVLPSRQYTLAPTLSDVRGIATLFDADIKEFGGKRAYARFSIALERVPVQLQHEYAHMFGNELYKIEGEAGIGACDTRFDFGCFHQFASKSIEENGVESIARLYRTCGEAVGGLEICQHGLGHGILAALGYSDDDLDQALDLCKPIQGDLPLVRCDGGVFMEYNIHTIANVEGTPGVRPLENGDYMYPCNRVKEEFRNACTFWLPQWWYVQAPHQGTDPSQPADMAPFQKMAARCAVAPYSRTCYEGIGYITIGASNFNAERARTICDSLGEKHDANLLCRGLSARLFKGAETVRGDAEKLCEGLTPAKHDFCAAYLLDTNEYLPEMLPDMQV